MLTRFKISLACPGYFIVSIVSKVKKIVKIAGSNFSQVNRTGVQRNDIILRIITVSGRSNA